MTLHAVDEFTLLQRPRKLPGRDISTTNNPNDTIKQEKPRGVATAKLRKRDAENAGGSTPSKTSRKRGRCSDKAPSNGDESHCEAKPTSRRRGKERSMGNGSSHPDGAAGSAASQGAFGIVSSSNERNDPASLATARRNATMATARDARPAASPQLLLTEAQRAAAFHDPSVPLLVVAAAGVPPNEILAVTFTRRAGQSLRQRLHQLAGAMAAQQLDKAASGAGLAAAAAPGEPAAAPAMQTVSAAAIADAEALMELLQEWAERKAAEAGEREEHDGNSRVGMPTGKKYRRRLVLNKAIDFSQFAPKAVKLLHAHPEILASSYMRSRAGTGSSRVPAPTTSKSHLRVSHVLAGHIGAHNDPDISAARTGGAPNGSYGRAPNGGAPPPPPSDPAWPPVLGPDDLKG
ncbi:hypothetical protein CLOM_g13558 [Closterium sp. NIES-68]|nr:hypothetical protein CLOM_g13558 [Closterium sp. NIES-68]